MTHSASAGKLPMDLPSPAVDARDRAPADARADGSRGTESRGSASRGTADFPSNPLTDAIERYRVVFFVALGVLFLLSFNGEWRLGTDSAIYRGLAHNLATGHGYTFGKWAPGHVYPGLPLLLGGVERVFGGTSTVPSVVLIALMGVACLCIVYRLVLLHYPRWVAVCVTCGLGTNSLFLKYSQELLTDVPFLLGVLTSLYAWELVRRARNKKDWAVALGLLLPGLLLAASMRPTFWILVAAWLAVSVIELVRGPRRRLAGACLGIMLAVCLLAITVDPRVRGFKPLQGGYEKEVLSILSRSDAVRLALTHWAPRMFQEHLPEAFFGEHMHLPDRPFGAVHTVPAILLSIGLFVGAGMLMRRQPLWGLMIFFTAACTVFTSTVPRYYVMVMPFLLLGSILILNWLAARVPKDWGMVVILAGLGTVTGTNFAASVGFLKEQRSTPFLQTYHAGKFLPHVRMAARIAERVPEGEKVIAPQGPIIGFLSGRQAITQREALGDVTTHSDSDVRKYPAMLAAMKIHYIVTPIEYFGRDEQMFWRLMERRVLAKGKSVSKQTKMELSELVVNVPPATWDWRSPVATADRAGRPKLTPQQEAERQARIARQVKAAEMRRKQAEALTRQKQLAEKRAHLADAAVRRARQQALAEKLAARAARHPTTQPNPAPDSTSNAPGNP